MNVGRNDETLSRGAPGGGAAPQPLGRLGPYLIEKELARGGMGCVYVARHVELGRRVALKTILGRSPRALARFQTEARATGKLQHPNIVTIHEVNVDNGVHYLVMELVPGESLKGRLSREGTIEPREAAQIVATLARAMHYAHTSGILHRDMKPANVLLREGQPVITDFGLAKDADGDEGLTKTGQLIGTPVYMPPEQAQGKKHQIDARSDVYSLGATLYEILTGKVPFESGSAMNLIVAVVTQAPPPPSTHLPDLDRDLERICMRCLEKEPDDRYPSAAALADALESWLSGTRSARRTPASLVVGVAAIAVAVVTALALLLSSDATPNSQSPPPPQTATVSSDDPVESAPAPPVVRTAFRRWRRLEPSRAPTPRIGLCGAFSLDVQRSELMLMGGKTGSTFLGDTWAWTGETWRVVRAGLAVLPPEPRFGHRSATDYTRKRIVLFGGNLDRRKADDTWEYYDGGWHLMPPVEPLPPRRAWHAMAWDGTREQVLLFGGIEEVVGAVKGLNDLWSWNGTRWREHPVDGPWPPVREGCGFAFDPRRNRVVLFGGTKRKPTRGERDDLWEWDGARWHAIPKRGVWPLPRHGHALVWEGDQLLLFGGTTTLGGRRHLGDTWAWNGERWTELAPDPAPSARSWMAAAWDPTRNALILNGGDDGKLRDDTWVWRE